MTIERAKTLTGFIRYDVWFENSIIASFDSFCDAVDFVRFFEEL